MFVMTGNIKFEGYAAVKPSSLKWDRHIDNLFDTAIITLPAMCRMKNADNTYKLVRTGDQIHTGKKVEFKVGYNGRDKMVFKGFVSRVDFKIPVEVHCEGYAYQLRKKFYTNLSFGKTTIKDVLNELTKGTDIKLSDKMPSKIEFEPAQFKHYTALQILEWIKEKYFLTVYFFFDELYVGWRAMYKGEKVKHRLNWNVANDSNLVLNTYTGSIVHIELETRLPTGTKHKTKAANVVKAGDVKTKKTIMVNEADKQNAANDAQLIENRIGYSGSITGFLEPYVEPGMTDELIDKKINERQGLFFVEGVSGSYTKSGGGRQEIKMSYSLNDNTQR